MNVFPRVLSLIKAPWSAALPARVWSAVLPARPANEQPKNR